MNFHHSENISESPPGRTNWSTYLRGLAFCLALGLLFALSGTGTALADEPTISPGNDDSATPRATSAYSLGELEVGVHYMADYGGSGDLPNSQANAYGFYNTLRYHPFFWRPRWCNFSGHDCYIYGDSAAWEDDWVDNNNNYVDDVDVVFYEGHGWPGGFTINGPDDDYVQHGEVQGFWGNRDLEWAFLLSCSVIADSSRSSWHGAMDGMHGIAGFRNTAYDVSGHGSSVATYIVLGYSYKDAWFKTCDRKQPSGVQAQIIVEDSKFWNETAYNQLSDEPNNGGYWYWWKSCGAPTPASVMPEAINNTFPVFSTPPLSLDQQNQNIETLSTAFDFSNTRGVTAFTQEVDGTVFITDTTGRELEIDRDTGLFYYYDANRTFAEPSQGRNATATLTQEDAQRVADQFLRDNGVLPSDAVFNTVDSVISGNTETDAMGRVTTQETATGYQVIYNRYLTANVPSADGRSVSQVQIPVDGPGAKIKVYVDPTASAPTARVARAGQQDGAVTGAMGGWRPIEQSARAEAQSVTLLDYDTQVLPMFRDNALEALVSYNNVPYPDAETKTVLTYTVSGWEVANGESQDVIYPAYRIDAVYAGDRVAGGITETVVFTGSAWIAGAPQYMKPYAKIEIAPEAKVYKPGDVITATATDATRTLADLGFGSTLTFAMGSSNTNGPGNPDDYTYNWYLGDVEVGKQIGAGRELNYTLMAGDLSPEKNSLDEVTITLRVTREGSSTSQLSNTDSVVRQAVPPVYLPNVQGQ